MRRFTAMTSTSDGLALYQELERKLRDMTRAIEEIKPRGTALAQAEAEYRKALAKMILRLRDEGKPVSIVGDLARGDEEVAMLRLKRDAAEVLYKSAFEAVNGMKLQVRVILEQIKMEVGNAERG